MEENTQPIDPQQVGPKPPFPAEAQGFPGSEARMDPKPDYGEESYKGTGKLEGRSALITGGDSGIGRAVALAFAREGADVAISYYNEHEDAQETRRVIEEAGRRALLIPGDIRDEQHCRGMIPRVIEEFGKVDILVNNAAFQTVHREIQEITAGELDQIFRTNVYATFMLMQEALKVMGPGGVIINTSSVQAYEPDGELAPYAATKEAIKSLTMSIGKMAIKQGIRVNAVAPGPVWTPLIPASFSPDKVKEFGQSAPIGRPAQPAELAPAYVFLASNDASYIATEVLGVTGGLYLA